MKKHNLLPAAPLASMLGLLLYLVLITFTPAATYTNPVSTGSGADPSVLLHNGTYYFYATNDGSVYKSTDLINWTKGPNVYPDGFAGLWAPDVSYDPDNNKFYMHFTKDYHLYVAESAAPDQQFTLVGQVFTNALDSHLFRDDDGSLYLYFVRVPGSQLYVAKMAGYTKISGPFAFIGKPDAAWELHDAEINEGPWMVKHNGKYYLMYSGSDAKSKYYAVGLAIADSPLGPFTKYSGNPVFEDLAANIYGPGHGSVTRDKEGTLWHLYHQKPDPTSSWNRYVCLDKLYWDANDILRGDPTNGTTQPGPVVDANLVWSPDIRPRGAAAGAASVAVTITSHTAGAQIRYTTDGTDPTASSLLYSGAVTLTQSATVKARAFKSGLTASTVTTQPYTIGGTALDDGSYAKAFRPCKAAVNDNNIVYDITGRVYHTPAVKQLPNGVYISTAGGPVKIINLK